MTRWTATITTLALVLGGVAVLAQQPRGITFTDVTTAAGIRFTHNSGRAGQKFLPETLGSGAAFFDADGDGWPDLFLVNSKDWAPRGRRSSSALYRNTGKGTFTDITAAQRAGCRDVRDRSRRRRLRQRRPRRICM